MGLTLSGVSDEKEDMSPILTKTIIQGFVDLNQTKATFATIGGGTTTAIATRHKIKVFSDGHLLGVPVLNDCKITSPFTVGETGQTDPIDVYGVVWYKGVAYQLYADVNGADTRATLAAGTRIELMLDGAIPVFAGDEVYVQMAWIGSASTINCPRHNIVNLNEDEGYLFFDSGTPATDATAAIAAAINSSAEWLPIVGNQQKSDMTVFSTRMPAPAGLLLKVRGNQRHIAIRGTSRSIGNKNPLIDPSLYNDSFLASACAAKNQSYFNGAIGSAIGVNDEDNPQYSANRRWLEQGATEIWDEHLQNDLANDYSLPDILRRAKNRAREARAQGQRIIGFTVDPYTTTSVTGDWTLASTQTVADSDTSTKRTSIRTLLKGTVSSLHGFSLQDIYDRVLLTSEEVEAASNHTLWADATVADTGTATSTSATTLVQSTKTWTPYAYPERYVVGLTAADAITKGIVTSNAPASLAITSTTLTVASWSNGTHGNKAYTIYNTVTNDGLHATFYGNRLKQAVVETYLGGTSTAFSLNSIPWDGFWIAHPNYCFTDTGCSIPCGNTDAITIWVDSVNGYKALGTTTTRPTYSPTSTYGGVLFDNTDDYLDFLQGLGTAHPLAAIAKKQHRLAVVTVLEIPDSNSAIHSLFYISNNAGNTRFHAYFETGGGVGTGLPASNSRVDEAGTQNADNWPTAYTGGTYIVRIDYVDYQEGKQYGWINGTIKLDDSTAWAASKGLSVDTASTVITMSRVGTVPLGARVVATGLVNNFEFTPYIVRELTTLLSNPSSFMPSGF